MEVVQLALSPCCAGRRQRARCRRRTVCSRGGDRQRMAGGRLTGLVRTDEAYIKCSTAIYFEGQVSVHM